MFTMKALCVLLSACIVTAKLASQQRDESFKSIVVDKLKALETKYAQLETENKQLRAMVSTGSEDKRQAGSGPNSEVAFSSTVSSHIKGLAAHQTIIFDNVLTNVGGSFNANTGVFHTPVSGTYLLFANILSEIGESIETEIMADGNALASIYSAGYNFFGSGSNLVVVHLDKGSEVLVRVHDSYGTQLAVHCCWSSFSGYLLRDSGDTVQVVG